LSAFEQDVAQVLRGLGAGEVVSYAWVANEAGHPRRARAVGRFLAQHGDGYPWWRVVRADGRLVSPHAREQEALLRAEGVTVVNGRVPRP
jgi:alkylated DNA nucleotide flippase Atl1